MKKIIDNSFLEHIKLANICKKKIANKIEDVAELIFLALKENNTLFWCGNGGSSSDSMHFSAEFIGRYKKNRKPLKSLSLASDQGAITCIANDFGYENIFSRQIQGIGRPGDILICLTTSGNSRNIINAVKAGNKKKLKTILISGNNGGKCSGLSSYEILIPSKITSRIQEMQKLIGHLIIELVEKKFKF